MAIYHFSAQIISRSQGRSSVAASAYRSAEKMVDERTGLTQDFTRKQDVIEKVVLLPVGAPAEFSNRERLWNAVESVERRKDAQLAREINIALPCELTNTQNWSMATEFVQREFVDQGMIADMAFHRGHSGEEAQPHVHVLLTMRAVSAEGFGQKVRDWNGKGVLKSWRERWAEHCNHALARAGHDMRIDHRTLEAQGINLEPQSKIGPKSATDRMARFAEHQDLAQRNGERLLADPSIALKALTHQQSTFSHQDIARFVNRHTVDANQFQRVLEKVKAHPELMCVGHDDRGQERFSTRDLVSLEARMLHQAVDRSESASHAVTAPTDKLSQGIQLSQAQQGALTHVTEGGDLACLVGFAGSGKSMLLGAARSAWESNGYSVKGMTLSGIAAENLEKGSGISSRTVASHLWHWEHGNESLHAKDVIVVDEAGMLGSRQMAQIMTEVTRVKAKLVLVGDPEQLQAIAAGAAFRAITERVGFAELNEIHRQRDPWQRQATREFATAETESGLNAYLNHDRVHSYETPSKAMEGLLAQWNTVRQESPASSQIILAYTRSEVSELNSGARALRHVAGELGQDQVVETDRGVRSLAEGDRLYFLRNDRDLGVKNGTLGTLETIDQGRLAVRLDGEQPGEGRSVAFDLKQYNAIDHGYAATVYKAQGVTVDRAHVLASTYFDRHSSYVAMSRHRSNADLYVARDVFRDFAALTRTFSRARTKDVTVDYGLERVAPMMEKAPSEGRLPVDVDRLQASVADRESLSAFKRQFEAENPELAQALSKDMLGERGAQQTPEYASDAIESPSLRYELPTKEITPEILRVAKQLWHARQQPVDFALKEGVRGHYRGLVGEKDDRFGLIERTDGTITLISADRLVGQRTGALMEIQVEKTEGQGDRLVAVNCERDKTRSLSPERSGPAGLETQGRHDKGYERDRELER